MYNLSSLLIKNLRVNQLIGASKMLQHTKPVTQISNPSWSKTKKFLVVSGTVLSASTIAYGGAALSRSRGVQLTAAGRPIIVPTRSVSWRDANNSKLKLTLFQYQTCPFCCKVRAFLDYNGFNYDVVEVNPVFRNEIKFSSWKKVPILLLEYTGEGENKLENNFHQLNDSSLIVSALQSYLINKNDVFLTHITECYPLSTYTNEKGKQVTESLNRYFLMFGDKGDFDEKELSRLEEERKWRRWADEVLVHTLSPNVYRTTKEAIQAFKWFSIAGNWENTFNWFERTVVIYVGSAAMYLIGKKLKTKYGLKEDVRESFYDNLRVWLRAVGQERKFMGGDDPNLADLAVYGVLSSIEGCETFSDALNNTNIEPWFNNMKAVVGNRSGSINNI